MLQHIKIIMKMIGSGLGWLLLVGLLFIAINLKSPYLFSYRSYEVPFLLTASSVLMMLFFLKTCGIKRVLSLAILLTVMVLTLWGEGAFRYRKDAVLINMYGSMPGARLLGEHFIVGYEQIEELEFLISQGLIGGIFITQRNVAGKSIDALREEIAALQQLRSNAGLPQLIITTDQEGGIVSHVSPPLERQPPLASLVEAWSAGKEIESTPEVLMSDAEAYGREQGQSLATLGITVNFSPVVDLKSNRTQNRMDFHSLIDQRAISADPILTSDVAGAYVRGLQSQGVRATLKHFPGLGRVQGDTHHFSVKLDVATTELQAHDWIPFKMVDRQSNALIMLGHVILPQIDNENPASFSKDVIQGIIREDWKHEGILVTDDLTMRAAYSHGLCRATVKALNAGVDFLLISYDYDKFYEAMYCASQAYENGSLDRGMLARSHERLSRSFQW